MDQLDINLLNAWDRVFEQCRRDPKEARRRYERVRAGGIFDRPPRAYCVGLRASDTRLDEFVYGDQAEAMRARAAHEMEVDGYTISALCGPVDIPFPGVRLREAAAMLGRRDPASLSKWLPVKVGKTVAEKERVAREIGPGFRTWASYYAEDTGRGVLNVKYMAAGKTGMEIPYVWCDHSLDPGGYMGRPPSRYWGSLWRYLADEVPKEFEQALVREPVVQPYGDGERFRGWQWRCPGLIQGVGTRESGIGLTDDDRESRGTDDSEPRCANDSEPRRANADYSGCGRLVRTLYAPLPVRTIGQYDGIEEGLEVEGLSGQWLPGVMDRWAGRRSLACERCWKIKRQTFTNSTGWNELVTYLSGGLLYGRDVEQPAGFEYERRRAYKKRARRSAEGASAHVSTVVEHGHASADQSIAVKLSTSMK